MSGIETTNGATIFVHAERVEGTTLPYALVYLFDKEYIPFVDSGLGIATVADINGNFSFSGINIDTVSLTLISSDFKNAAYVKSGSAGVQYRAELNSLGVLKGSVVASDSGMILVFIQGTAYYKLLSGSGVFEIGYVPQGTYAISAAVLTKPNSTSAYTIKSISAVSVVTIESGEATSVSLTVP